MHIISKKDFSDAENGYFDEIMQSYRKHNGVRKSSWSQIGNRKSFTLTIPWNSAKLVKIFPGIIARLHHTDRILMVLQKEQCAE